MTQTLGGRIAAMRRECGFTQEELAEKLGISAQAVSKWENDLTCPDISLLPALAKLLGVTTDTLLTGDQPPEVQILPAEKRKSPDELMLRVRVLSKRGDKVKVNLPLALAKVVLDSGLPMQIDGKSFSLQDIDWEQIMQLVERGMIGKLVEVESAEGDTVEVFVE